MKQVKNTITPLVLEGDNAYSAKDLAMHVYGIDLDGIERRHTIPVVRAMKQIAEEHPQIEIWRSDSGTGRTMYIFDVTSPIAHAMYHGKQQSHWYNKVKPDSWKASDDWKGELATEEGIRKSIKEKDLKKGGQYHHTAKFKKSFIDFDEAQREWERLLNKRKQTK